MLCSKSLDITPDGKKWCQIYDPVLVNEFSWSDKQIGVIQYYSINSKKKMEKKIWQSADQNVGTQYWGHSNIVKINRLEVKYQLHNTADHFALFISDR